MFPRIAFILLILTLPAAAQESEIFKQIGSGAIEGTSLVALPPLLDRPPEIPSLGGDLPPQMSDSLTSSITDKAYPLVAAKWPLNQVFVCWEDPDPAFSAQRTFVRVAIQDTWEKSSGLIFLGWTTCVANSVGIRIRVEDTGPHVKYFGKFIDGVEHGMVLNFTYQNWSPSCQGMMDYCNRAIAVHEFGHAIGFAHEQNRPDTPGECHQAQGSNGDTPLTPWDIHSVMNYCNPVYANDGALSEFDIIAVQYMYGLPR